MSHNSTALAVWTALVLVSAVSGSAATTPKAPPIAIASCVFKNAGGSVGALQISYENEYKAAATSVKFYVKYAGTQKTILDTGSFAPNVTITHLFHDFTGQFWNGKKPDKCVLLQANFADGQVWAITPF